MKEHSRAIPNVGEKESPTGQDACYSDAEIARIVFDALRRSNPRALLMGDPTDRIASAVLIDGNFNLRMVAKHIKARLGIKGMPSEPET